MSYYGPFDESLLQPGERTACFLSNITQKYKKVKGQPLYSRESDFTNARSNIIRAMGYMSYKSSIYGCYDKRLLECISCYNYLAKIRYPYHYDATRDAIRCRTGIYTDLSNYIDLVNIVSLALPRDYRYEDGEFSRFVAEYFRSFARHINRDRLAKITIVKTMIFAIINKCYKITEHNIICYSRKFIKILKSVGIKLDYVYYEATELYFSNEKRQIHDYDTYRKFFACGMANGIFIGKTQLNNLKYSRIISESSPNRRNVLEAIEYFSEFMVNIPFPDDFGKGNSSRKGGEVIIQEFVRRAIEPLNVNNLSQSNEYSKLLKLLMYCIYRVAKDEEKSEIREIYLSIVRRDVHTKCYVIMDGDIERHNKEVAEINEFAPVQRDNDYINIPRDHIYYKFRYSRTPLGSYKFIINSMFDFKIDLPESWDDDVNNMYVWRVLGEDHIINSDMWERLDKKTIANNKKTIEYIALRKNKIIKKKGKRCVKYDAVYSNLDSLAGYISQF